ncbi:hypothetical protein THASP1DRAFT_28992 [Thamnocephalis sphaerospora]|uniref:Lung seven transmembrane receptor-domain-containing protein n=1 Tax=Thamnocephalis sphaerospora TaxID=78915 RepID=A0A4P9XUU0_9FUNG|nr:hypothetical protein THASP1DRAFT_28992 [Thamnocephalis sphaerospora]|eukprot:RKP09220.1 hypothetical protein THASP1DRAFT_28992 [Thamnocephalis sphaerospora]
MRLQSQFLLLLHGILTLGIIHHVCARLVFTQSDRISGATKTASFPSADYFQFEQPYYERTGMLYVPAFARECRLVLPSDSSRQADMKPGANYTMALLHESPWQAGCQSYKQAAQLVIDAEAQLRAVGYPRLGALVVVSTVNTRYPAGLDAGSIGGLDAATPITFLSLSDGKAALPWFPANNSAITTVTISQEQGEWNRIFLSPAYIVKQWVVLMTIVTICVYGTYRLALLAFSDQRFWSLRSIVVATEVLCRIPYMLFYLSPLLRENYEIPLVACGMVITTVVFVLLYIWIARLPYMGRTMRYLANSALGIEYAIILVNRLWSWIDPITFAPYAYVLQNIQQVFMAIVSGLVLFYAVMFFRERKRIDGPLPLDDALQRLTKTAVAIGYNCASTVFLFYFTPLSRVQPSAQLAHRLIYDSAVLSTHYVLIIVLNVPVPGQSFDPFFRFGLGVSNRQAVNLPTTDEECELQAKVSDPTDVGLPTGLSEQIHTRGHQLRLPASRADYAKHHFAPYSSSTPASASPDYGDTGSIDELQHISAECTKTY